MPSRTSLRTVDFGRRTSSRPSYNARRSAVDTLLAISVASFLVIVAPLSLEEHVASKLQACIALAGDAPSPPSVPCSADFIR